MSKTNKSKTSRFYAKNVGMAWAFGTLMALGLALPASAQYSVASLGSLGGDSQANALSFSGTGVGVSFLGNGTTQNAFLTPSGGMIQSLGTLGGANSVATGVTASATQVVGYSDTGTGATQHAFLYTAGGTGGVVGNPQMIDLGTLSGVSTDNSLAFGVNALGQIVGNGIDASGNDVAFRTAVGETTLTGSDALGTLGGTQSTANAVNTLGQAVGNANLAGDAATHAFLTAPNGAITAASDLGTLGGSYSSAAAVNAIGQAVGDSYLTGDTADHAALWTQGSIADIGTLAAGDFSQATGINDLGSVVGFSNLLGGGTDTHAFLYQNGQIVDLNTLIDASSGWTLEFASAISDTGQIAGYGLFGGTQQAFLLTPAPEPSSVAVLTLGAGAVGCLIARRRRCVG